MAEYIKKSEALDVLKPLPADNLGDPFNLGINYARRKINAIPAADMAEVKHGKWIGWHGDKLVGIDNNGEDMYRHYHYNTCSECDKGSAIKPKYCPNCGAKMDLED